MVGRRTILYFAPHQDDELLTMGIDIIDSLQSGYDVKVILCSDGSASSVRAVLNNGKSCSKHEGVHNHELSSEQFIEARDREFVDSCLALGVARENIFIADRRGADGKLTDSLAKDIILHYLTQCGRNAVVCTTAPNNGPKQHHDHKMLGKAAEALLESGDIKMARLFVEPYHYRQICENPRMIPLEPYQKQPTAEGTERIRAAIASYSLWQPQDGRYAVGYHSVTNEFNDFLGKPECRYYVKNSRRGSLPQRLEEKHRKWIKLQKQKQHFYSLPGGISYEPTLGDNEFIEINVGETDKYKEFCKKYNIPINEKELQRLRDGSYYRCLANERDGVLARGWVAYKQHFYIGETDFEFCMQDSDAAILYDFYTAPAHRGKGLYGILLHSIMNGEPRAERYVIYTSPDNNASSRGILKAGFKQDGTFRALGGSMQQHLNSLGFSNIRRKHLLRGLIVRK